MSLPTLADSLAPHLRPNDSALPVVIHERSHEALCVFQDPCEDPLVSNHGQIGHAMMIDMLEKCGSVQLQASDQARAANQRPTRLAPDGVSNDAILNSVADCILRGASTASLMASVMPFPMASAIPSSTASAIRRVAF